ncbi:hypothetical protein KSZ_42930 [Dictyobacter formicarum]|uniref:CopC domain-containing protein n=2 Tax=Dictyobacter formicarum TaxID=2778368 RepID=A0ABQ3VK46_9CHLR|nr:hypothetical protein KSZ_42930 [Dictyobacter formicarum]
MQYGHEGTQPWRLWCSVWGGVARVLGGLLIIVVAVYFPVLALARSAPTTYAEYVSSNPAANAFLLTAPTAVAVHFSARLDIPHSTLTVLDVNGKQVSTGLAQADRVDPATLVIAMQANQSEIYIVNWHTVAAQGNYHDGGSFRFFVHINPLLKGVLASAPAQASKTAGAQPASSYVSKADRIGVPLWLAGLIGLAGLVVGVSVMWSFSQQIEHRRAIALIVPTEDD